MAGRRGSRTGRGWDAAVPSSRSRGYRRGAARDAAPAGQSDGDPTEAQAPAGFGAVRAGASGDGRRDDGKLADRDPYELAREICLRQLAVRPRTHAELAAALSRRGVADDVAQEVLGRYREVGMIDDAAFARAWVDSRHRGRGLAGRALAQELRRRGVDSEIVSEAVAGLDPEIEQQTANELALRRLRGMRGEPDAIFRRLVGMLARKGYSSGVAVRAVKDALAARSAEDAEIAEAIDPDAFTGSEDG